MTYIALDVVPIRLPCSDFVSLRNYVPCQRQRRRVVVFGSHRNVFASGRREGGCSGGVRARARACACEAGQAQVRATQHSEAKTSSMRTRKEVAILWG